MAFVLTGSIDLSREPELDELLAVFRDSRSADASVDLARVTFFDSVGLGFLAQLRQLALRRGGQVRIRRPSAVALRTLRLVAFDTVFEIVP